MDAPPGITLDVPAATDLAWLVLESLVSAGVPSVGVSFGGNDPATAVAPMDWGVLIPLWFMGVRHDPPVPLVVVTPARDLPASAHVEGGPYGFHASAAVYDELVCKLVCKLVRTGNLAGLSDISPDLVEQAKADSWWQMLMLHGATTGWSGRLISYEAPTYFGMMTAAYLPAVS